MSIAMSQAMFHNSSSLFLQVFLLRCEVFFNITKISSEQKTVYQLLFIMTALIGFLSKLLIF